MLNGSPENKNLSSEKITRCSLCRTFIPEHQGIRVVKSAPIKNAKALKVVLTYCTNDCKVEGVKRWDQKIKDFLNSRI